MVGGLGPLFAAFLLGAAPAPRGSGAARSHKRARARTSPSRPAPPAAASSSSPGSRLDPEAIDRSIPPAPPRPAETATGAPFPQTSSDEGLNAISLEIRHGFERAAARERVTQLLEFWRDAYGVVSEWQGDRVFMRGRVHGVAIQAFFDVADRAVIAVARDPGWPWRGKAESYVGWMLRKYLHPTYQAPPEGW